MTNTMMAEYIATIIFNSIGLSICFALTIFGFITIRMAYHLLTTNPKSKNEDSNRFFYGRWRKIGGMLSLFWGLAFLTALSSWLLVLHLITLIAYVLVVIWGFKWDDGRLPDRVVRDIP